MKRILYVVKGDHLHDQTGKGIRTNAIYNGLLQVGNVDVLNVSTYHRPEKGKYWNRLEFFLNTLHSTKSNADLVKKIKQIQGNYDLIVFRYIDTALLSGSNELNTTTIIDVDDVPWRFFLTKYEGKEKGFLSTLSLRMKYNWMKYIIHSKINRSKLFWLSNSNDVGFFGFDGRVTLLKNLIGAHVKFLPKATKSNKVLFVGNLDYNPNKNGLKEFVAANIDKLNKDIQLVVVGKCKDQDYVAYLKQYSNISYRGFVKDLDEYYKDCYMTIAPINVGGGTKIKVIESFGYNRPCLVTSHAMGGIEWLFEGRSFLIQKMSSFYKIINEMHVDAKKQEVEDLSAIVRKKFSMEDFTKKVTSDLITKL